MAYTAYVIHNRFHGPCLFGLGHGGAPDAILGTTFFGKQAPGSFGKFDQALVSMFCVAAGMGWPQVIS